MLELIKAQEKYANFVKKSIHEYIEDTASYTSISTVKKMVQSLKENDFASYFAYIKKYESATNLDCGKVKQTIFWLFDDGQYIGTFALRHSLTDALRKLGGNIAYQILPSKQGKKYAQKGLALCLAEAKKIGLEKVLITCDEKNIASYKVIYNTMIEMGGIEGIKDEVDGAVIYRAWVNTKKRYNNQIRPLAIAVIKKENKILVMKGYDNKKDEYFYRLPGGGIEFAETATDCLKREIKEELGLEIDIIKQLPTYENIFEFNGHKGHEIVLPYECALSPKDMQKDKIYMIEDEFEGKFMEFVEISPNNKIYPPIV